MIKYWLSLVEDTMLITEDWMAVIRRGVYI